jgi:hypothetical protein
VNSRTTERFRTAYWQLPAAVRLRAQQAYRLFTQDPTHPSLRFKQVHAKRPIFSARIGLGYRALGVRDNDEMIWFWIGSQSDYDQLLSRQRCE